METQAAGVTQQRVRGVCTYDRKRESAAGDQMRGPTHATIISTTWYIRYLEIPQRLCPLEVATKKVIKAGHWCLDRHGSVPGGYKYTGTPVAGLVRLVCLACSLPSASLNFTRTGQGRRLIAVLLCARTTRRGAAPCSDLFFSSRLRRSRAVQRSLCATAAKWLCLDTMASGADLKRMNRPASPSIYRVQRILKKKKSPQCEMQICLEAKAATSTEYPQSIFLHVPRPTGCGRVVVGGVLGQVRSSQSPVDEAKTAPN